MNENLLLKVNSITLIKNFKQCYSIHLFLISKQMKCLNVCIIENILSNKNQEYYKKNTS